MLWSLPLSSFVSYSFPPDFFLSSVTSWNTPGKLPHQCFVLILPSSRMFFSYIHKARSDSSFRSSACCNHKEPPQASLSRILHSPPLLHLSNSYSRSTLYLVIVLFIVWLLPLNITGFCFGRYCFPSS